MLMRIHGWWLEIHRGLGVTPLALCWITIQRLRGCHYEEAVCCLHISN